MESEKILVKLPSKGECYPHKKGEVAISPMTAMDENILADKKLREENKAVNALLERKILDKDFKVDELYVEDRNAILLSIIKDGYGSKHINPIDGKEIDLDTIKYSDGSIKADENGWLEYCRENQPLIKFRVPTHSDELETYKLMGDINDENFRGPLRLAEKFLLKRITISIDGKTEQKYIDEYINGIFQEDRAEYIYFLSNNLPSLNTEIDFDVLLLSKINLQMSEGE